MPDRADLVYKVSPPGAPRLLASGTARMIHVDLPVAHAGLAPDREEARTAKG
jgi:hypothetical protein